MVAWRLPMAARAFVSLSQDGWARMSTRLPFSLAEEQAVLRVIQRWSPRNRTLLVLGFQTGFRASELGSIRIGDVFEGDAVRSHLTVERARMKGGKGIRFRSVTSRTVPLNSRAQEAIAAYMASLLGEKGFIAPNDFLFRSQHGRNGIERWQINRIVQRAARQAGLLSGATQMQPVRAT